MGSQCGKSAQASHLGPEVPPNTELSIGPSRETQAWERLNICKSFYKGVGSFQIFEGKFL